MKALCWQGVNELGAVFGYSHAMGGFRGSHAEYVRVPYARLHGLRDPGRRRRPERPVRLGIPMLLDRIAGGELSTTHLATHVLPLDDGPRGYEMFRKKEDNCLRVVFRP